MTALDGGLHHRKRAAVREVAARAKEHPGELADGDAVRAEALGRLAQSVHARVAKRVVERVAAGAGRGHPLEQRLEPRVSSKDAAAPVARRKRPAAWRVAAARGA